MSTKKINNKKKLCNLGRCVAKDIKSSYRNRNLLSVKLYLYSIFDEGQYNSKSFTDELIMGQHINLKKKVKRL